MTEFRTKWENSSPTERRVMLAAALRNTPHEHQWNYCSSAGCAIGLFNHLARGPWQTSIEIGEDLGLTYAQRMLLFFDAELEFPGLRVHEITPQHVATILESF